MSNSTLALDKLLSLEFFGMKLGLQNITELLEFLGRPDRKIKTIHVAGTNGKGSVCATLAAIYQTGGARTGLFTSPHLIDYRERIRVDGEMISHTAVGEFVDMIWPLVTKLNATFFEVTTALAFHYFAVSRVDIAIIETGLGGRLDATNVLEQPLATVITSIGRDHMQQLGNSIEEIANEKGGIFKHGIPAIVNVDPGLRGIFEERARSCASPILLVQDYPLPEAYHELRPSLVGGHQLSNLRTALVTLDAIGAMPGVEVVGRALVDVAQLTGLRARLESRSVEFAGKQITVTFDVGHNEEALRETVEHFALAGVKPIIVMGFMRDKDIQEALRLLSGVAHLVISVSADTPRALPSEDLAERCEQLGIQVMNGGSVGNGMALAFHLAKSGDTIALLGSHYVVGEYLANENKLVPVI